MEDQIMPEKTVEKKNITLEDIAQRCQVSTVTVSRALRGVRSKVSPEMRERILAVAQELGYDIHANSAARRLVLQGRGIPVLNHLIALFFPFVEFDAPYFLNLFRGAIETLTAEHFGLVTGCTSTCAEVMELLPVMQRGEFDGILALGPPNQLTAFARQLHGQPRFQKKPVVSMINPIRDNSSVLADDFQGGYLAARHLLEMGHRHILHFTSDHLHMEILRNRYLGYRKACDECNLDPDRFLHSAPWHYTDVVVSHEGFGPALAAHPEATAILAPNDPGALMIVEWLRESGVRVPEDISLVGFDDTDPLPDALGQNILTTIHLPLREIGREAARLVIRQVRGETEPNQKIVLPCSLVVRRSVLPC